MLLVLIFDESGLNHTRYYIDDDGAGIELNFEIFELHSLLVTGYLEQCDGGEHTLWVKQSESKKWRYNKRCHHRVLMLSPYICFSIIMVVLLLISVAIVVRHN